MFSHKAALKHKQKTNKETEQKTKRFKAGLRKAGFKSIDSREQYKACGIAKTHHSIIKEAEGKTINPPKNRYYITHGLKQEERFKATHTINRNNWSIDIKGKDWVRLNNHTVHKARLLDKSI